MFPVERASDSSPLAVGVEIADGATRLSVVLGSAPTARHWQSHLPAPPTPEAAMDEIDAIILRALREHDPTVAPDARLPPVALGIAVSGRVDARAGIIRTLPQAPGWTAFPLASRLADRWHAPVRLDSAVNAAALAAASHGAGAGHDPVLYVAIARSISAALVMDRRPLHGARGLEGSLAHMQVRAAGPRCSCGAHGHLEPIASAQALVRAAIGRASDIDESLAAIQRITGGRAESLTAPAIVRLADAGEPVARAVLDEALDALALALANAIALFDPGIVIIGGPLAAAGDAYCAPLRDRLFSHLWTGSTAPPVVASALEPRAVLLGASLLADIVSARPA